MQKKARRGCIRFAQEEQNPPETPGPDIYRTGPSVSWEGLSISLHPGTGYYSMVFLGSFRRENGLVLSCSDTIVVQQPLVGCNVLRLLDVTRQWLRITWSHKEGLGTAFRRTELQTYWDYKHAAQSYQQAWQQLHSQAFPLWPRSDRNLLLFH
ncbi:tRNA-specific adenosine deaminase 1 [Lates japonicus]|uniref:tRNA-specific adenosine deaminase 1 n=1 Tax=Lates japonicus TaxID=270547 RepID=A0AAD3NMU0_LATJO|nr:tRNA-specific adenosine deaminase 1 [Lates japonicus]